MDYKHIQLEWKADAQGTIEGYGAVFDNVDLGGDIVARGAFSQSLRSGRRIKMLFNHCPDDVIGVWDEVSEDGTGLRVKGRIVTQVQQGRDVHELAKAGALDGLSIGYQTKTAQDRNGVRVITEADLWEVSVVTFPMNELARIDAVKAADLSRPELERLLTLRAGLSRSVARGLLAGGFDGIKGMRGAADGADEELLALLRKRASL
ncbi:MAG: HK97 family phage prohead protease [Caulobacteraceae bacterium]|nr:HK97 family phage prohead protease [Caulobacteraceae bacterium]